MNISFKKDLSRSYMVVEKVREFSERDFGVRMLLQNEIPYLLKADVENLNGQINMLYDISSRHAFLKRFESGKMTFAQIRNLIFALRGLLRTLHEYLLDENNIILKKECIFTDPEGETFAFCYFPYYNGNLCLELKELFAGMFSMVDYEDEKAMRLVHELHQEVQQENVTIDSLLRTYERISAHALPEAEKPSFPEAYELPRVEEALGNPWLEEEGDYEDDATFFERARFYLKGKKLLDVLEDINSGDILEKIRASGKAPDVLPALDPASLPNPAPLPMPKKPDFEYILLGEHPAGVLAEESRYGSGEYGKKGSIIE